MTTIGHHIATVRQFDPSTGIATVIIPALYGATPIQARPFIATPSEVPDLPEVTPGSSVIAFYDDGDPTTVLRWYSTGGGGGKLVDMPANRLKGAITAGVPQDLTAVQSRAVITSDASSYGTPTTLYLRGDGSFGIPPGGGGIDVEAAQDVAAAMFTSGTHTLISATYDDPNAKINLAISDPDLVTIAGLTATTGNVIQSVAGVWASQSTANLKTSLNLVKGDVGLSNVDNTSDVNKPVSSATATALNLKFDKAGGTVTGPTTFSSTVTGAAFFGDGAGLTLLNATNIATGTLAKERLPTIIDANTTGSAAKWTTARTITLGGDLTGNVSIDGTAHVTLTATIAPDSVALGADTTGSYIATLTGTTNRITVNGVVGEAAAFTLTSPQDMHTLATPTFERLTLGQATGTAPMTVASATKVANLNADLLDGYEATYLMDWANVIAKPDPTFSITLTGPVQGTASKLWTDLVGNVDLSIATTMPGGAGSNIDADKLDGLDSTYFLNASNLSSGTLPSGRLTGTYTINIIGGVTGNVTGNADTATKLQTPRTIAGFTFDGTQNVTLATLTRGGFLTGSDYNGSTATTWAVDATSANTVSKVVARDAAGDFFANVVNVSRLASTVITGTPPLSVISTTLVPNLNVEKLQGYVPSDFASRAELEAVLGDLRLVGAFDAAAYTGSWASMPPSKLLARFASEPLLIDANNVLNFANLVPNSNFTGVAVAGLIPGYTLVDVGTIVSPAQSVQTINARPGEQYQRFVGTYDVGDCRILQLTSAVAVTPGAVYRFRIIANAVLGTNTQLRMNLKWASNAAMSADVTETEVTVTPTSTFNNHIMNGTAPALGNFCMPSVRIYGATGAAAAVSTANVARMEFTQAPELRNTGSAGNAVIVGRPPIMIPEPDDSYFFLPGSANNSLSWVFAGTTSDPSYDFRVRCRWDEPSGREHRIWAVGFTIGFNSSTIVITMTDSLAASLTNTTPIPAGFPGFGEWVDLRSTWNAATDTMVLDWRASVGELSDNTGWTFGQQTVHAGKIMSEITRTFTHSANTTQFFKGGFKQALMYVNGALVADIDVRRLTSTTATSFVATTGQTVTITRTNTAGGVPALVPSRFLGGRASIHLSPGSGDYITMPNHATLNFGAEDSMTMLLTMRQSATITANGRWVYKYAGVGATGPGWMLSPSSTTVLRAYISDGTLTPIATRAITAPIDMVQRTWTMRLDRATDLLHLFDGLTPSTSTAVTAGALTNTGSLIYGIEPDAATRGQAYTFVTSALLRSALTDVQLAEYYNAANGGSDLYQHGTYWVCSSSGTLDFIDSDWSGRYEITDDDTVDVYNGDWILCFDPLFGTPGHTVGTWHPRQEMVFQYIPFSTETYVKSQIADHVSKSDPHDQYVLWAEGVTAFAPFSHDHPDEIATAITVHEGKADPHSQYLTEIEGSSLFMPIGKNFDAEILDAISVHELKTDPHQQYLLNIEADLRYEVIGAVTSHEAKTDPHPIYLTASEGDVRYDVAGKLAEHEAKADPHPQYLTEVEGIGLFPSLLHNHDERYYQKTEVDAFFNIRVEDEVTAVDVAQSARVWIGGLAPPSNPKVGDLWFSAPPADQLIPTVVSEFNFTPTSSTSISLYWVSWPPAAAVTSISLESSPNDSTWAPVAGSPLAASATTYVDSTAITENLVRYYRIRANNAVGSGPWSTSLMAHSANVVPPPPTALVASSQTPTSIVLSWTAPTWSDPGNSGARYEAFRNGSSVGFALSTATTYTFTGLTENTQYTLGVSSKDSGGLSSSVVTINSAATKTTNAAPPNAPTGVSATASTTIPSVTVTWTAPFVPADFLNYEVQVVQTAGSVVLQTRTTTSLTMTFDDVAWGLQVYCRVRVMDALGAGSAYADSSNVTTRINPAVTMGTPTLAASTDVTITWTEPAVQVGDFVGYTLNVYDGAGSTVLQSIAKGAVLTHTFNDLAYGLSRRYAVVITRSGSLAPLVSAYSPAISTIADPVPRSLTTTPSGNTITCGWVGPAAGEPADKSGYRCRLWAGSVVSEKVVAGGSAAFTGLSYATNYNFDVRLERSNGQHSSFVAGPIATTGPNPDTTPPGNAAITAFKPFNAHGQMYVQGTWPGDADLARVVVYRYYSGGPGWEVIYDGGASPGAFFSIGMGTIAGGTYMECAIDCFDARGNVRRTPHVGYTVAASPSYVYADATNYWRSTNGGEYNPAGNYKMYVGYYSVSSYNAVSYIYYGYKIYDQCVNRTVTWMQLYLHREGGGNNAADVITTYIHNELYSPGTVAYIGNNAWIGGSAHDWGTLTYGAAAWAPLSSEQIGNLAAGYRGIALWRASGKPYMFLYALSSNASQGCVAVYHLG